MEQTQRDAWLEEIRILQNVLKQQKGSIYFEYSIPRMGKRIDVVLVIGSVIFVLEFKVEKKEFHSYAIDQVWDYALDLKNFHETSHNSYIAPVLIATKSKTSAAIIATTTHNDKLLAPIKCNEELLAQVLVDVLQFSEGEDINPVLWESGRYQPISSRRLVTGSPFDTDAASAADWRATMARLPSLLRPHARSLGIAAVLLVLSSAAQLAGPLLVRHAIDVDIASRDVRGLAQTVVAYVVVLTAFLILRYLLRLRLERVGQEALLGLRKRLFSHVLRLSMGFHDQNSAGRLISRVQGDTDAMRQALSQTAATLLEASVLAAGTLVVLGTISPALAGIVALLVAVLFAAVSMIALAGMSRYRRVREQTAAISGQVAEHVQGVAAIQAFAREMMVRFRPTTPGRPVCPATGSHAGDCRSVAAQTHLQPLLQGEWPGLPRGRVGSVTIDGQYAYVCLGSNGPAVLDISNPSNCRHVSHCEVEDFALDVAVSNGYAYVADDHVGLHIFSVINPTAPLRVGQAFGGLVLANFRL